MIVTLSGKPGSGKSTVAKKLSQDLEYERHYVGGMRREMARQKGMTLAEFNEWSEDNKEGDQEFDDFVESIGQTKDNLIIESRTAFHFIPNSLKIYIDVTSEEGAKRIWNALQEKSQPNRNEDKNLDSYEEVLRSINDRLKSDHKRYQMHYGLDILDKKNYDLWLDATNMNEEQEYRRVYNFVKTKLG